MKAYGYIRVSSIGQSKEDKDGYIRQETLISEYCQSNNIELVSFYYDSVSGTIEERKSLTEMLYSIEKNGHNIKTIIVENLSRLSRDLYIQETLIKQFQDKNIELISVQEGDDLLNNEPTRILIRQIFGSIHQFEKNMMVEKLRVARQRKREKNGKCEGRKSYVEYNKDIITRIKQLRRKRKGYDKRRSFNNIAEILNEEGYKTISGKDFGGNLVSTLYAKYR